MILEDYILLHLSSQNHKKNLAKENMLITLYFLTNHKTKDSYQVQKSYALRVRPYTKDI